MMRTTTNVHLLACSLVVVLLSLTAPTAADYNVYEGCSVLAPSVYTAMCVGNSLGSLCDSYYVTPITADSYTLATGVYAPAVCGVVEAVPNVNGFDLAVGVFTNGNVKGWDDVLTVNGSHDATNPSANYSLCSSNHGCCSGAAVSSSSSSVSVGGLDREHERSDVRDVGRVDGVGGVGGAVGLTAAKRLRGGAHTVAHPNGNSNKYKGKPTTAADALTERFGAGPDVSVACSTASGYTLGYSSFGGGVIATVQMVSDRGAMASMFVDPSLPKHAWSFSECSGGGGGRDGFGEHAAICVEDTSAPPPNATATEVLLRVPTAVVRLDGAGEVADVALLAN